MIKHLILVILALCATSEPLADSEVKGHVRRDGTYVSPHRRTTPNESRVDNYNSKGNVNPYTGKRGTVDPYAPKRPRK